MGISERIALNVSFVIYSRYNFFRVDYSMCHLGRILFLRTDHFFPREEGGWAIFWDINFFLTFRLCMLFWRVIA